MNWTKEIPNAPGWWWYDSRRFRTLFFFDSIPNEDTVVILPGALRMQRYIKDLTGYWSDSPVVPPEGTPVYE